MTKKDMVAFMNDRVEDAKSVLKGSGNPMPPCAFVVGEKGVGVMSLAHSNIFEKRLLQVALKAIARKEKAEAVVVVFESWIVEARPGDAVPGSLENDPRRTEAVVVEGACPEGRFMITTGFVRERDGVRFLEASTNENFKSEFTGGIWGGEGVYANQPDARSPFN